MRAPGHRGPRHSTSGSVAIIFALAATVIFGAAGMAVDFISASSVRAALQSALDSAVLAAASAHVKNDNEARTIISEYMTSNWSSKYPDLEAETIQSVSDETVTGQAQVRMPTSLTSILGFDTLEIVVNSTATIASETIEIAMVIDNSSSMRPHLNQLKQALISVVDTLSPDGSNENVSFAVIPYSTYVNVGVSNKNQSWLSFDEADVDDWEGCVGSRDYPLELDDDDGTPIPAVSNVNCNPTEILPLTSDATVTKSWIDSLTAEVMDTYTGAGLVWGWRALSDNEPYTEARRYGEVQKVIIFLTDAFSTVGPSYPKHNDDDNMAEYVWQTQCTNIKAKGIVLYTIAYQTSNDRERWLSDCATSASHALTADNSAELKSAFEDIAAKLATVYLSN
jgi:Flp pilus assembly protein TadG